MNPFDSPEQDEPPRFEPGSMVELHRFDIVSVGKLLALLYAAIGFMIAGIYAVFLVIAGLIAAFESPIAGVGMMGGAVAMFLFVPIFYGLLGGLFGMLMALVYNLVAGRTGGLRFELR